MKLATWNVNSLAVRLPQLLDWLAVQQPDVLVLQETKLTDDKYPQAQIAVDTLADKQRVDAECCRTREIGAHRIADRQNSIEW